jgi:hypothetical protein
MKAREKEMFHALLETRDEMHAEARTKRDEQCRRGDELDSWGAVNEAQENGGRTGLEPH